MGFEKDGTRNYMIVIALKPILSCDILLDILFREVQ